jgi:hypothetical protein
MERQLVVRISDIRTALERTLHQVEKDRGAEVDLGVDHYWVIDSGAAFDVHREPEVTAGQLSDDIESLRAQLAANADEPVVWHDLEHLVGLLRRIASLDRPPSNDSA